MLSATIAVGAAITATRIIALVFPAFPAATIALQIFMIGLVFIFANYPVGNLLNATNHQLLNTTNMGIALAVNIVLNFFLIPEYTYVGATVAAVITAVVLVGLGLPKVYREVQFDVIGLAKRSGLVLAAALGMGGLLWLLQGWIPQTASGFVLLAGIGAVVYGGLLFTLRALHWNEVLAMMRALRSKLA
jgi:O-antigen/teichoic acid export membrane protein